MAISEGYKANFETIKRAAGNNDLALMECTDKTTGKPIMVVCAVSTSNGEYVMSPLAKLFDDNPYEELIPPI
jgi:Family of unknown function (DUF6117)